ncbi:MAG: hypothetical protein AAB489_06100 [Patescibacteria group bacterium]
MWKELTLRLTACEMGLFPGQIVLSEGMKELVRQPFGTNMPSAARLLIPADPRFNENPEVQYLDLHKGELAQYRFLEVWEKILQHFNHDHDLLINIHSANTAQLCQPFEQFSSLKLKSVEYGDGITRALSQSVLPVGSFSSVIFRRVPDPAFGTGLNSSIPVCKVFCYVGDTPSARVESVKVKAVCQQAGADYEEVSDITSIASDQPWILYFIGHGGANGIWHGTGTPNLLPQLPRCPLDRCECMILNCCNAASYVPQDEVITSILSWSVRPRHLFAYCHSIDDSVAIGRGVSLLEHLFDGLQIHLALSACIVENRASGDQRNSIILEYLSQNLLTIPYELFRSGRPQDNYIAGIATHLPLLSTFASYGPHFFGKIDRTI